MQNWRTYEEAVHPSNEKNGAAHAPVDTVMAWAAQEHGYWMNLQPKAVYEWAKRHDADLICDGYLLRRDHTLLDLLLADKPLVREGVK